MSFLGFSMNRDDGSPLALWAQALWPQLPELARANYYEATFASCHLFLAASPATFRSPQ